MLDSGEQEGVRGFDEVGVCDGGEEPAEESVDSVEENHPTNDPP